MVMSKTEVYMRLPQRSPYRVTKTITIFLYILILVAGFFIATAVSNSISRGNLSPVPTEVSAEREWVEVLGGPMYEEGVPYFILKNNNVVFCSKEKLETLGGKKYPLEARVRSVPDRLTHSIFDGLVILEFREKKDAP